MVALAVMPSPIASPRRTFTGALLAAFAGFGCKRESSNDPRTASMKHEPWVLWPDGAPPPGGWPVLVFLHGEGEAAWIDYGQLREQGPEALEAHDSPVALHRKRDPRVPTLWKNFVLIAPQAFNTTGFALAWHWGQEPIKARVAADVERVLQSGKVDRNRVLVTGFSRGGQGCYALDADAGPLQFKRIASVDAQDLNALFAVVARQRKVRAYYTPASYEVIREFHEGAAKAQGNGEWVSFIPRPQSGSADEAHGALCKQVYGEDELYRWLLA